MVGLLSACSNDNGFDDRVPLRIMAGIESPARPTTRASETAWEAGDKIGVFVTKHNNTVIYEYDNKLFKNLEYTFNDGTNYETYGNTYRLFSPASQKIYLESDFVDIYAYHPYSAKSDLEPTAIEIDVSSANQAQQNKIDLLRANTGNVNNGKAAIELLFNHRMVKLVFNLKQGPGLLTNELKDATFIGMEIGSQPTVATYNIYTDEFSITPSSTGIVPIKAPTAPIGYVHSFEAIVLPTNNTTNLASKRTVKITYYLNQDDPVVNTFDIPAGDSFEKGTKYVYNVTINAVSVTVNLEKYTEQW